MKIALVTVGETQSKELRALVADYSERILHYSNFEVVETSEEKLDKTLEKFERIVLLEEIGKTMTSKEFSGFIDNQLTYGAKSLAFVIGGPFGFKASTKTLADSTIALSLMTFPHDLVRVIFLEQLYRAFTILKNEKYHH